MSLRDSEGGGVNSWRPLATSNATGKSWSRIGMNC